MNEFLNNSRILIKNLDKLSAIISEIEATIKLKQNSVLSDEQEEAVERKINKLDCEFDNLTEIIGREIKKNQADLEKEKKKYSKEELDIRKNHILKHSNGLKEKVGEYRSLKVNYKNKENEMFKKAFEVANPNAKDEDFEKYKENLDTEAQPFDFGSKVVFQSLKQAKIRKERLNSVVKTINKMVQLIEEIDELVQKNAEVVDEIVINMTDAEENVRETNTQLEQALAYQKKTNSLIKGFVGFLALGIIVVLIFFGIKDGWIFFWKK